MTSIGSSDVPTVDSAKTTSEFKRLKENSSLTVDELREFLAKMRGKSPQEVLGLVASSDLLRATVQATIGCIILLAATTALPIFLYPITPKPADDVARKPQDIATQATAANTASPAATSSDKKPDATTGSPASTTTTATNPNQPNLEKAAKKMGMDETKVTDPKKNPLENNLDKLLDKLE